MSNRALTILLGVALTVCVGLLIKVAWDRHSLTTVNSQLNKELMQSDLDKGRALTMFGDARDMVDKLKAQQRADIMKRKADVKLFAELEFQLKITRKKLKGKKVETLYVNVEPIEADKDIYVQGMHYEAVTQRTLVTVESMEGKFHDDVVDIGVIVTPVPGYEREIKFDFAYNLNMGFELQFVETHLPSGAVNHYATIWQKNTETRKRGPELKVTKFTVVVNKPKEKTFFAWAPHLDVGALIGIRRVPVSLMTGGSIGVSPMGYGLTVNDLDWRFLRLSLDVTSDLPRVGLTPVMYNIGQLVPLVSNVWVGPHVDTEGLGVFIGEVL